MKEYNLNRTGSNVKELLNKIDNLAEATHLRGGTMTANDKRKLDLLEKDEALSILEIAEILNF